MRQTNYQLFDFLDFDEHLSGENRLWKACSPTDIIVENGSVLISIPFRLQENSNEIRRESGVPEKVFKLRIKAYGEKICRVSLAFEGEIADDSEMLRLHPDAEPCALSFRKKEFAWEIMDEQGVIRAVLSFEKPVTDWWSDLQPGPDETIFLSFYPDGKHEVKLNAYDMFSPARHDAFPLVLIEKNGSPDRCAFALYAHPDACFYGTGERFSKMDLSGHTFQLRNQDGQGVNNRRTYKNIPFYLSSEQYGLFLHTTSFAKFSLADHSTRSAQVLVEEPSLDFFLIGGDRPEEILYGYRCLTGFPSMPPLWSFGVWMSRMTYFSEEEVNEVCDALRAGDFPCDVIHLDTGWFETDWLCEWKFNKERFADPAKFIANLKNNGFRVSLWQLPYIAFNAEQYQEAKENQYISQSERKISGASNFSVQDYAGTIDFTYDRATDWYENNLLRPLLEMGIDCIKTDFGEDIHLDAEYHGMKPAQLHNLYPLLYQKAAYEITKQVRGEGIVWARAGWAGCQRYPLHWGGDSACSWDGLAGSLKGGLHLGLSGFAFWSHDVPGFHGVPDFMNSVIPDDLYVRWTQFGVFSSHIRYHGSSKREPWHFPEVADIVRDWWKLRYRLIPYILVESEKCVRTGMPLLRALIFHHPEDKTCRHIDDEYYFGDSFLVAPVMNPSGIRDIYLPEGAWVHFFTKEKYAGNRWLRNVETPLDQMPVFVKKGAGISVYRDRVSHTGEMDMKKIEVQRF